METIQVSMAALPLEALDVLHVSNEDWSNVLHNFIIKVQILCGKQDAMARRISENMRKFENLFKDIYVRTVMPADLEKAQNAISILTEKLESTRAGDYAKFTESERSQLLKAGIEIREDGVLYANKFKTGNWGEGANQSGLKGPMTFKKKIGEFRWEEYAPRIAARFVESVRKIDSHRMAASLNHHFKDRSDAVATVQQKGDVLTDKQVSWNRSKNLLAVRYHLIKFVYKQLNVLLSYAHENVDGSAKEKTSNEPYYA